MSATKSRPERREVAEAVAFRRAQQEEKRLRLVAAARYDSELSPWQLSERFHVNRNTVTQWLREAGVRCREAGR